MRYALWQTLVHETWYPYYYDPSVYQPPYYATAAEEERIWGYPKTYIQKTDDPDTYTFWSFF